jgi:hypothetical protein
MMQIRKSHGGQAVLDPEVGGQLSLEGSILTPDSPEYDEARGIWNAMIDRRPALILRCATPDDVVRAVRFTREHDLLLAVRGGGHNIAGSAVCDGGVVIDLSPMRGVRVDPAARTARVEAGATLGDVDEATQAHGLATPLGVNSTTGIAGLTLGGGFGWLSRSLGLTVDTLLSAEVILADGRRMRASPTENRDLFWAIRGGGGNFGVVTSFEFRLHPVGPQVLSGLVVHPMDGAGEVLRFYRDFLPGTPEQFVCWFVLRKAPPLPFLPPEWHGREILALAMCWSGDLAEGERVAAPIREFGSPIADVVAPHSYVEWQKVLDPLLTPGFRNYWKSHDFTQVSDELIDTLLEYAHRIPDPNCEIFLGQLGGAVSRVPSDATAYTHREAEFVMNVHGRWQEATSDDACIDWAREVFRATSRLATGGAYVNFLTQDEGERVRAAYGANYERLVELKNRYDPTNLFQTNQNISPTTSS